MHILMCLLMIGLWCLLFSPTPAPILLKVLFFTMILLYFVLFTIIVYLMLFFSVSVVIPVYKKHTHLLTCSTSKYYHMEKTYINFAFVLIFCMFADVCICTMFLYKICLN